MANVTIKAEKTWRIMGRSIAHIRAAANDDGDLIVTQGEDIVLCDRASAVALAAVLTEWASEK